MNPQDDDRRQQAKAGQVGRPDRHSHESATRGTPRPGEPREDEPEEDAGKPLKAESSETRKGLNISIVVHDLTSGGAELFACNLAENLKRAGHVTEVVTTGPMEDFWEVGEGIGRTRLRRPAQGKEGRQSPRWKDRLTEALPITLHDWGALLLNTARVIWFAARQRPALLIGVLPASNIAVIAAGRLLGIATIATEHCWPAYDDLPRAVAATRPTAYKYSDRTTVLTKRMQEWFEAKHGVRTEIAPILTGVTREKSTKPPEDDAREKMVLSAGRLAPQKGFDVLLNAIGVLRPMWPDGWKVRIIGEGPEREALEAQIEEQQLEEIVKLEGVQKNAGTWYRRARVYVLSSRYEGFPRALLEGLHNGCAIVATDCPSGPREIVTHNRTGLLVPAEDPTALAEALQRIITNNGLRRRLQINGRTATNTTESTNPTTGRWNQLVTEATGHAGRPEKRRSGRTT